MSKRPGVITFIGILLYIKAAVAVIVAIAAFLGKGTDRALAAGLSDSTMLTTGIVEALLAVLLVLVAMSLMSGSRGARLLIAIVMGLRIAATTWLMVTHHDSGFIWTGIFTVAFALFILWALYGNDKSEEYFGDAA